ncbi:MAG: carbon-nitrogen hydrolase family protein [Blastocatellia bacterium]|nr:carbon-nitrogen hydrolase family protein [Blastocatellia bacterium]
MIVAAVQMRSTDKVGENLRCAEELINKAASVGAKLVALPENFAYLRSESEAIGYRQKADGELFLRFSKLAKKLGIYLLAGTFPEQTSSEKVYNSSLLISPDGLLLAKYQKIHLFDVVLPDKTVLEESRFVEAGSSVVTAKVEDFTLGMTICYDLRFPELYRKLVKQGANLIAVPSAFTLQTGRDHWEVLLRARAIENQTYIIAPAQYGQHTPHRASYGRSMIVDPWGTVLATAPDRECLITAEIDVERVQQLRALMPCLKQTKFNL